MEMLGEWNFAEPCLFDLRNAAYLIEDSGALLGSEGRQRRGQVPANLGGKGGSSGSLSDQGLDLERLVGRRIRMGQGYRIAG